MIKKCNRRKNGSFSLQRGIPEKGGWGGEHLVRRDQSLESQVVQIFPRKGGVLVEKKRGWARVSDQRESMGRGIGP